MIYLNVKTKQGVETIDELNNKDFNTRKEFIKELTRLKNEYFLCGMFVYYSSRSTKQWKEKN